MSTASIEQAVAAFAAGEMVVVVDDEDRENEGDLIIAADHATPEAMAFFVRHTSGLICAAITNQRADELDLPSDGGAQHRSPANRLHGHGGRPQRHIHGHLGS